MISYLLIITLSIALATAGYITYLRRRLKNTELKLMKEQQQVSTLTKELKNVKHAQKIKNTNTRLNPRELDRQLLEQGFFRSEE